MVRNELVLRLFLISTLKPAEARSVLASIVESSEREAATLRHAVTTADMARRPDAPLPFGRLAAEFGLRFYGALGEWAHWALTQLPA